MELFEYIRSRLTNQFMQDPSVESAYAAIEDMRLVDLILATVEAREQWLHEHNFIDVKYTDDMYGDAARELGLIAHAYEGDAGIDLPVVLDQHERSCGIILGPNERRLLHTGMQTAFPKGYWGLIIHRSSTEYKQQLRVVEGVIDDYRDELLIHVHNINNSDSKTITHGQKLGQLVLIKTASFNARVVDVLRPSQRGTNGFGSTGI